ncbi:MAG TPA: TadE family protein [Candidatus Limnocylindria bacterium]|nr:TadE family protein [Candidatus Limnocylindria bacterium]
MIRSERGNAAVEFALAVPVILLVLIATLDLGRLANSYAMVKAVSREGARYAIVHADAADTAIASYVRGRSALLDPAGLQVTASYYDGTAWKPWAPHALPSPGPSGAPVRVSVSYSTSAATTILGRFLPANLTSTAVMDGMP